MPLGLSWSSEMGGKAKVVGVKRVKEGMPEEEWDESMLLPGDIIEGVAPVVADADEDSATFTSAKGRSELSSLLGRLGRQSGSVWVKVRRGDAGFLLRARVAPHRSSTLHRRYTLCADRDDRHVAMLADLTMDRCAELQEMSRKVVNIDFGAFSMKKGIKYDWKKKVGTYLPDRQSTVISSILFMPLPDEHKVEAVMTRSMAWFSAAVSSGAPLIFVNIQTEQIIVSTASSSEGQCYISWYKQQSSKPNIEMVQGIRLWFLPGIAEVPVILELNLGETRFGMDIKRTEEGFICINSVTRGLAADRAGVRKLYREASKAGHLVLISRLDGRSLIPSEVSAKGLIHCCDHNDIKERLAAAMEQMEEVHLHIMAWPDQKSSTSIPTTMGPSTLLPPSTRKSRTASSNEPDESS
ncbi:uncharacterized protein [Elaeis guineensis]|uniref:Uncharacterized protein LOC105056499 isoform X2 n=1 Tax=Elaeis guineensis var. tenera TaxID=51953 RepID=A0A6J0PQI2_ELAGV|nr:uncharacterized protein LOC105056499 isoform X2 [Elaeis guineensis]